MGKIFLILNVIFFFKKKGENLKVSVSCGRLFCCLLCDFWNFYFVVQRKNLHLFLILLCKMLFLETNIS
uniref:Uncharacterized protein n=1 Tax=Cannabis sativa TaxID=3483 RepID=A0A803QU99_CANSA